MKWPDLRGEAEALAHLLVAALLQRELAKRAGVPGYVADRVARRVGRLKRAPQGVSLLRCRLQLELGDQLHRWNSNTPVRLLQSEQLARRFLPGLKLLGCSNEGLLYLHDTKSLL